MGGAFFELPLRDASVRIGSFSSRGRYSIQLNSLRDVPAFDEVRLTALIDRYEEVEGIRISATRRWKKPAFDLALLEAQSTRGDFFAAVTAHVDSVRSAAGGA